MVLEAILRSRQPRDKVIYDAVARTRQDGFQNRDKVYMLHGAKL